MHVPHQTGPRCSADNCLKINAILVTWGLTSVMQPTDTKNTLRSGTYVDLTAVYIELIAVSAGGDN